MTTDLVRVKPPCSQPDCTAPVHRRDLCRSHYERTLRRLGPDLAQILRDRFWLKVEKTEGCWIWHGTRCPRGYGRVVRGSRNCAAYRLAYEELVGPIPPGLVLDHLCRNTSCVRPDHLEAVTDGENTRRANLKWHCKRGHELSVENRRCEICLHDYQDLKKRRAAERAAFLALEEATHARSPVALSEDQKSALSALRAARSPVPRDDDNLSTWREEKDAAREGVK